MQLADVTVPPMEVTGTSPVMRETSMESQLAEARTWGWRARHAECGGVVPMAVQGGSGHVPYGEARSCRPFFGEGAHTEEQERDGGKEGHQKVCFYLANLM